MILCHTNQLIGKAEDIVTAEKLNKIEEGITNSDPFFVVSWVGVYNPATFESEWSYSDWSKTPGEIYAAFKAGKIVLLHYFSDKSDENTGRYESRFMQLSEVFKEVVEDSVVYTFIDDDNNTVYAVGDDGVPSENHPFQDTEDDIM